MRAPYLFSAMCVLAFVRLVLGSELHSGDSVQNSLRPGATQAYSLNLQAGDVVSLELTDTGQDVVLTVLSPDGQPSRRFSSKLQEGESVAFYASLSGAWQISLS